MSSYHELRQKNVVWKLIAYVVMVLFTILTIGPLIWLLYSAFKPHIDIIHNIFAFPKSFYIDNFVRAWKLGRLGIYILNSIFYSVVATSVTTFLALAAGYAFAKFKYKISGFFYFFFIMGLLITVHSVLVPLFVMETKLRIDDTRLGVLLPYVAFGLPMLIYLATAYIKGIPDSLEEAAVIDGAGYLTIFRTVIIPMAAPVTATMIIFSFLGNWNEFVFVLTLTSKTTLRSLPVGVNAFAAGQTRNYGVQFAALVIATAPMIIFYLLFHRQLARGFAAGALKE
jgi:raffinose/stachyose/melibiose transport system permease protein